ncbi:MAG: ShlB/FhaC/HecB family hemolysin secretion/activation protein [Cyanobacteria bacterium P01_A01_bin.45]
MFRGNYLPLSWLSCQARYIYLLVATLTLCAIKIDVAYGEIKFIKPCKDRVCGDQYSPAKNFLPLTSNSSPSLFKEKNILESNNLTFAEFNTGVNTFQVPLNIDNSGKNQYLKTEDSFIKTPKSILLNWKLANKKNRNQSILTSPRQIKLPFNLQDIINEQPDFLSVKPQLPPPEEYLNSPDSENLNIKPNTEPTIENLSGDILVKEFEVEGSTVFSQEKLLEILKPFTERQLSFSELMQARSAITKLYVDKGYITSGALIPPQTITDGTIKIKVVEGGLESININGLKRLNSSYIRNRIASSAKKPVNIPRLLESLRILQSDPLIKNLSAELMSGSGTGSNILDITLKENRTFGSSLTIDNGRSPSVGSIRRRAQLQQANLLGFGDNLNVGYTNTDGSNGIDAIYSLPINSRNVKIEFSYGNTNSKVIEDPFNSLDIISNSRYYELTLRQPLFQSSSEEFNLGITASRRESKASFLEDEQPFPSIGADDEGRTRISAIRFFQEWTKRSSTQVIAARSQFNVGFNAFNATINDGVPDSRFLSWRGQAQWVRLLAPDTLLFVRGDVQLADNTLVPTEQFGNGGFGSVRGYRQDLLLTDNGALLSAELRLPILKKSQSLLQVVPFFDIGTSWNSGSSNNPVNSTLAAVGLGLQFSQGNILSARLDWGIPLISVDSDQGTLQENGLYFSITTKPF